MALHEQSAGRSDEWYTPPQVFEAMGVRFDMDVSSPGRDVVPWIPATMHITGNSLRHVWAGFVWMNPPFGARNAIAPWLAKFMAHGDGVALVPDRTSAPWWHQYAAKADGILFVGRPAPERGRPNKIQFISGDGRPNTSPAQGTCLLAKGARGLQAVRNAADAGLGLLLLPSDHTGSAAQSCAPGTPQETPDA